MPSRANSRPGWLSKPMLIALPLYLVVGSVALASLTVKPQQRARPMPAAASTEECPVTGEGRPVGAAQLASLVQEQKPAGDTKPAEEKPAENDSASCITCHGDIEASHPTENLGLAEGGKDGRGVSCVGCHGGNGKFETGRDGKPILDQNRYHVMPRHLEAWKKAKEYRTATGDPQRPYAYPSGNPERTYALLNRESADFIRFVNPGDLRVAQRSCGSIGGSSCHGDIVHQVRKCMMTHGGFLYGAALYNNGVLPNKDALVGESYSPVRYGADGKPKDQFGHSLPEAILGITEVKDGQVGSRPPKPEEAARGVLPFLVPLPRWEISQVGNIFRQFERGGLKKPPQSEVGNPNREEDSGKPDEKLSSRGHGTVLRTDPQVLGAQKTRLLDPLLGLLGTNDHPGDFRSAGCSGCHYVYANDRDPVHSGPFAKYGHLGHSFSKDKALATAQKTGERGHPITHTMKRQAMPTSQCIVCHIHPGTNMVSTYLGYTWWDNETDADQGMYPPQPRTPSNHERDRIQQSNPEGSALKGNWGDTKFLENVTDLNPKLKHSQFADFHGHGWVFRAAFKRDRKGNLLDKEGKRFWPPDNWKAGDPIPVPDWKKGVHLKDIHLEKGMHCVDCHFKQDNHGTGKIYSEGRAAIEIACEDCHGSVTKPSALTFLLDDDEKTKGLTSAAAGGQDMEAYNTIDFKEANGYLDSRFYKKEDGSIWQRSAVEFVEVEVEEDGKKVKKRVPREWPVAQIADLINPKSKSYNPKAALAKTIRQDGRTWGVPPASGSMSSDPSGHLAHDGNKMTCFGCHSAWTTSCFGCHLSMTANNKKRNLHNEGQYSRNWVSYNFQTLRDDLYMLGKDGVNTGNRVAPVRSACAVLVSSQNQQRDWIYYQQQTVSGEGYSGTSFSSYVPHTVRGKETKQCTDCHLSERNDNNAWMANLMLQGTNSVNHIGRYAYVANEDGMSAVMVAEREEPTAVIGSYLHRLAYPDKYKSHVDRGRRLGTAQDHHGHTLSVQLRGEYLYAAEGPEGTVIYDVANVDNKNFSERIVTAPVSPWGQRFFVRSKYAVAVASPSTMLIDPGRKQFPENREQTPIHPLYKYIYILDKYEGLIVVKALTLMDGNPTNNFLSREKLSNGQRAWNPDGILNGATSIQIAGRWVYITSDRGLVIVDIDRPTAPKLVRMVSGFHKPNAVAVQFRYAFVTDEEGLKVVDITMPEQAALVQGATMRLDHCHSVYVSRTYAYIAAGPHGVAIVDVENPERPKLDQIFNAGGQINDAHDVKIGTTINCFYAYVADGKNGLRILQLTAPDRTPGLHGYSPRPMPELIATYRTPGPALNVSEGLDRDRAVDESGNQLSVFGRKGARPFNLDEQRRMYMRNGQLFRVSDDFPSQPIAPEANLTRPVRLAMTEWLGLLPVAGLLLARKARRGGILVPWRRRRRRPTT